MRSDNIKVNSLETSRNRIKIASMARRHTFAARTQEACIRVINKVRSKVIK